MSDLISRKVLLEALEDYGFNQDTMIPTISLMKVLEIIEEQPTAYDMEKVVEQLDDYLFDRYFIEPAITIEIEKILKGAVKDE